MSKVAIIGNDKKCLDLVPLVCAEKNLDVVYVNHKHAIDANEHGIPSISDYKELSLIDDLDLVIDTSNDPQVENYLLENLDNSVVVITGRDDSMLSSLLDEKRKIRRETKKSLRSQKEIYELGIILNSAMTIQEMADRIIECATHLTNTPAGSLMVYNTQNNTMCLIGIRGFSEKFSKVKEWEVLKGGLSDFIMNKKEPVVINDIIKEASFHNPLILEEGIRSVMAVPLISEGNKIEGILYVNDFEPRDFAEDEISELALLATQAAFALQKVFLLDKLSEATDYMEAILTNSPDMIITTDRNTDIVEFNPGAEIMLGYKKKEVVGTSMERFYPNRNEYRAVLERVMESGHVSNYETRLITRERKALDISLSLSELKDKEGRVVGTVSISKDITRQKKLEKQLKRSNKELAQKIEEVKKIDKMKSDFLSIVSHELRTPLTSIIGFSKMILRRFNKDLVPSLPGNNKKVAKSAEKIKENLEIVFSEGNRLSRLINNVLDLAKIEAGKVEWNISRCSPEDICKSAVNSVRPLADEKNIALSINAEDNLPDINGDHDRLVQVVTNLLSNAIKFTDRGSVTCTIRNLGGWVEVRVIDTGIGLRPEDMPQVFEKFKQIGDTLTDRPKGTGLGLPICREIVEAHDGKIWVESEYGVGSQFAFILKPTKTGRAITIRKSELINEIKDKLYNKIQKIEKGRTILVVDDEPNIRKLLCQELEEAGYKVIEAADGSEALNKARNLKPDLIILDILMPVVDGFDTMTILKNDETTSNIPILVYSITDDQEKMFHFGADEYITKSSEPEMLLKTVSSLIAAPGGKQKKVLLIEDNKSIIKEVRDALEVRGYEVIVTGNSQDGISKAQTESPDLIIIDGDISRRNNNEILKALKDEKILILQP